MCVCYHPLAAPFRSRVLPLRMIAKLILFIWTGAISQAAVKVIHALRAAIVMATRIHPYSFATAGSHQAAAFGTPCRFARSSTRMQSVRVEYCSETRRITSLPGDLARSFEGRSSRSFPSRAQARWLIERSRSCKREGYPQRGGVAPLIGEFLNATQGDPAARKKAR